MNINISYDSSVAAGSFTNYKADGFASGADEEAAFKKAVTAACNELESLFTNSITLNITFAWGGVSAGDCRFEQFTRHIPEFRLRDPANGAFEHGSCVGRPRPACRSRGSARIRSDRQRL